MIVTVHECRYEKCDCVLKPHLLLLSTPTMAKNGRFAASVLYPYIAVQLHGFYLFRQSPHHSFQAALWVQSVLQKSAWLLCHTLEKFVSIKRVDLGTPCLLHQV
jgi:hypothetical protein